MEYLCKMLLKGKKKTALVLLFILIQYTFRYYLISQGLIKERHLTEFIPYFIPILMYLTTNRTLLETILMWLWIVTAGSFHFGVVGVNAAHHHPEIFHDGDTPRYLLF